VKKEEPLCRKRPLRLVRHSVFDGFVSVKKQAREVFGMLSDAEM